MTPELKAVPMDELSPLITGLIEDGTDVRFTSSRATPQSS